MFTPDHLARRVTGKSLDPEPFLSYVERKYGELYKLDIKQAHGAGSKEVTG
jgi:carboxypeptidase Taq